MVNVPNYINGLLKKYTRPSLFANKDTITDDIREMDYLAGATKNRDRDRISEVLDDMVDNLNCIPVHILLALYLLGFHNCNKSLESVLKERLVSERVNFAIEKKFSWSSLYTYQFSLWPAEVVLKARQILPSVHFVLTSEFISSTDSHLVNAILHQGNVRVAFPYVDCKSNINSIPADMLDTVFKSLHSAVDILALLTHPAINESNYGRYVNTGVLRLTHELKSLSDFYTDVCVTFIRKFYKVIDSQTMVYCLNNLRDKLKYCDKLTDEVVSIVSDRNLIDRCRHLKMPVRTKALFISSSLFDVNDSFFFSALKGYLSCKMFPLIPSRRISIPDDLVQKLSIDQLLHLIRMPEWFDFKMDVAKSILMAHAIAFPDRAKKLSSVCQFV